MRLTINEIKGMTFEDTWRLADGTKVDMFKEGNMTPAKHEIVEGGMIVMEYGEGLVAKVDGEEMKLRFFIEKLNEVKEINEVEEVETVEEVKTLDQNESFKIGDKVNVEGDILTVKSTGESVYDEDYGQMYKRIIRYENSIIRTFGLKAL